MKKNNILLSIFFIVVIILCLFYLYYLKKKEYYNNNDYGFIITRHVNNESANKIWISCITQIRKFYPDILIVIIDDNSNYEFISYPDNFLNNCIVIDSEYKGSGELLPYYYFYHNKWFKKAIYIHDSVDINGQIDISEINNIKFLWYFNSEQVFKERPHIEEFLGYLNYSDELLNLFHSNDWIGCFGVMCIINHDYLKHIADKYNLFILLNHIKSRIQRMALERVFSLICYHDKEIDKNNTSMYGYFYTYLDKVNEDNKLAPRKNTYGR
jgi:hypothetical protein